MRQKLSPKAPQRVQAYLWGKRWHSVVIMQDGKMHRSAGTTWNTAIVNALVRAKRAK